MAVSEFPPGVALGRVEVIDALVQGVAHQVRVAAQARAAEADVGHANVGAAQLSVLLHRRLGGRLQNVRSHSAQTRRSANRRAAEGDLLEEGSALDACVISIVVGRHSRLLAARVWEATGGSSSWH